MAGGRPGIEPGSLPYSNVLPCGRTASGGGYPYYWGIHQSGMKSFSMGCLLSLVVEHVHDGRFAD